MNKNNDLNKHHTEKTANNSTIDKKSINNQAVKVDYRVKPAKPRKKRKINKNLSRNDFKKKSSRVVSSLQPSPQTAPTRQSPRNRFSFKDIAIHARVDIERVANDCGLNIQLLCKAIQIHPIPYDLQAGIVDIFRIFDVELTIKIEVAILCSVRGETFPIISFSMDGKSSIFNGYHWFVKNEHSFLTSLNKRAGGRHTLENTAIASNPAGGV